MVFYSEQRVNEFVCIFALEELFLEAILIVLTAQFISCPCTGIGAHVPPLTILLLNSTNFQPISCPCTGIGVHVLSPTIFCLNSTNAQLIPCSCMGIGAHVFSSTIVFLLISTGHILT
jgi:hypothetical protein